MVEELGDAAASGERGGGGTHRDSPPSCCRSQDSGGVAQGTDSILILPEVSSRIISPGSVMLILCFLISPCMWQGAHSAFEKCEFRSYVSSCL